MPTRKDEAFVLARYPYRERDLVVTLLARKGGLLRVLARRARGVRSRLAGVVEPLARVRVSYFESPRSELATLDEAVLVASSFALARAPRAWAAGQVVAELALVYCPPGEVGEASFRLVDHCVAGLLRGESERTVAAYGQLWFLRLAGVFPDVSECSECGSAFDGSAVWEEGPSAFVCPAHRPGAKPLPAVALRWLQLASRSPLGDLELPPALAMSWLIKLQQGFSGREIKSLRILDLMAEESRNT